MSFAMKANPATHLATKMLERLRQATEDKLSTRNDDFNELNLTASKPKARIRLPVDSASYAVRLAYCLAPHFRTLQDMVASKAFVAITCPEGDDGVTVGKVLAEATAQDAGGIALKASRGLRISRL